MRRHGETENNEIQTVGKGEDWKFGKVKASHLKCTGAKVQKKKMNGGKEALSINRYGIPVGKKTDRLQESSGRLASFRLVPLAPVFSSLNGNYVTLGSCGRRLLRVSSEMWFFLPWLGVVVVWLRRNQSWDSGPRLPEESRFHIWEWNACWHSLAGPWYE